MLITKRPPHKTVNYLRPSFWDWITGQTPGHLKQYACLNAFHTARKDGSGVDTYVAWDQARNAVPGWQPGLAEFYRRVQRFTEIGWLVCVYEGETRDLQRRDARRGRPVRSYVITQEGANVLDQYQTMRRYRSARVI